MTTNTPVASLRVTTPEARETYDTQELQRLDSAHFLHPFTDHAALRERGARVIVRGDGVYLWDSEGNKIIDGMAGLWCVNAGYGRTSIADAVHAQMLQLPFYNSFFNTTNVPAVKLAALLASIGAVVAARAGLALPRWRPAARWLIWVVVAYMLVGVVLNAMTPSPRERALWLPVTAVLAVCALVVARAAPRAR